MVKSPSNYEVTWSRDYLVSYQGTSSVVPVHHKFNNHWVNFLSNYTIMTGTSYATSTYQVFIEIYIGHFTIQHSFEESKTNIRNRVKYIVYYNGL